ncbi:hypothetical protein AMATHDRAFT_76678 [Amanita thiersii Skay4041]|uniref:tRNA-guanine(15) transglycosylase-like domain-containing protein n=1 Tax=Amanita thiersii Skay4041 TaxID=703135 RepID=A0A2A9NLE0_9AGAR|nr:hypothetical protein AMATHDRAFT_76678 [Amanita thiersii Skay4041]
MQFTLSTTKSPQFSPRLGNVLLRRHGAPDHQCSIDTPGFFTSTSRGVIPHLSRDHHDTTQALSWVNVPFETFLERSPPVPTLQNGEHPLHSFLGFRPDNHILSMMARNPADGRDMPPNGNNHVSTYCLRGVRKLTPAEWRLHTLACQPDIVIALSDTPYTNTPYSQKRLTKSIERSAKWLADILRPVEASNEPNRLNVLVHMAGGTNPNARQAFSDSLLEILHGKEAEQVAPLRCLDEGLLGYTFDLLPLRQAFEAQWRRSSLNIPSPEYDEPSSTSSASTPIPESGSNSSLPLQPPSPPPPLIHRSPVSTSFLIPLIHTSLSSLPSNKLRLINTTSSPHEILRLIQHVGIDLFDAHWAQRAADIGIALDFTFPACSQDAFLDIDSDPNPIIITTTTTARKPLSLRLRADNKRDIGHNIYDARYTLDFSSFANCFSPASAASSDPTSPVNDNPYDKPICLCAACSPLAPQTRICHGPPDLEAETGPPPPSSSSLSGNLYKPPYTRAYLHHLLHTHEMSAHSLLLMHNLSVLDAFFSGIRNVIAMSLVDSSTEDVFAREVDRFMRTYDEELAVFDEAALAWREVDLARGKGRLAREKENARQEV